MGQDCVKARPQPWRPEHKGAEEKGREGRGKGGKKVSERGKGEGEGCGKISPLSMAHNMINISF